MEAWSGPDRNLWRGGDMVPRTWKAQSVRNFQDLIWKDNKSEGRASRVRICICKSREMDYAFGLWLIQLGTPHGVSPFGGNK